MGEYEDRMRAHEEFMKGQNLMPWHQDNGDPVTPGEQRLIDLGLITGPQGGGGGRFERAGSALITRMERGVYDAAKDLMRESLVLCPLSDATTYIEGWGTSWRTINGRRVHFDDAEANIVGDEGTLRRSSRVFPPVRSTDRVEVTVGYGFGEERNPAGRVAAEYAVPVHEKSELHHTPPEQSHYLLDPLLAFSTQFGKIVAEKAKETQAAAEALVVVEGKDLMAA